MTLRLRAVASHALACAATPGPDPDQFPALDSEWIRLELRFGVAREIQRRLDVVQVDASRIGLRPAEIFDDLRRDQADQEAQDRQHDEQFDQREPGLAPARFRRGRNPPRPAPRPQPRAT